MNICRIEKQIFYYHTDAGGVLYHGRYLDILEEGRADFFEKHGWGMKDILHHGYVLTVVKIEQNFRVPIFYADCVICTTELVFVKQLKIQFQQILCLKDNPKKCHIADITLGAIGSDFKPKVLSISFKEDILRKK